MFGKDEQFKGVPVAARSLCAPGGLPLRSHLSGTVDQCLASLLYLQANKNSFCQGLPGLETALMLCHIWPIPMRETDTRGLGQHLLMGPGRVYLLVLMLVALGVPPALLRPLCGAYRGGDGNLGSK